jgi:hypothetical protein
LVNATASTRIQRNPVLGRQQLRVAPAMWFKIRVTEGTDVRVDFLIRSDNLYLSGFTNKHDTFAFKVEWEYRMQASRSLSFGSSYPQLFRGRWF